MEFNRVQPAPTEPIAGRRPISRVTAVLLSLGCVLASATALIFAFGTSLCSLFGETCSDAEQTKISVLTWTGMALGVGGPIGVAWLRRAAVWAITPLILVVAGLVAWGIDAVWDL